MPAASASKSVVEIKGKNREFLFHPHFIYEEFISLSMGPLTRDQMRSCICRFRNFNLHFI